MRFGALAVEKVGSELEPQSHCTDGHEVAEAEGAEDGDQAGPRVVGGVYVATSGNESGR